MSGPTRPPSGAPRQPWSPEQAPTGVTCPACGLANDAGARVCRNCGLPIASASDPLRGVSPGHVDMPSAQRSGLSATVGLVIVVGLLLVGGTLAVSGGGILSSGGRLGVQPVESASPAPVDDDPVDGAAVIAPPDDATDGETVPEPTLGTSFDFTCEAAAVKDLSRGKWEMRPFVAGSRISEGYDQVTFEFARQGKTKAKSSSTARMQWMDPAEALSTYGAPIKVQGSRALVVTFDGTPNLNVGQTLDSFRLEPEGVTQIRNIQLFDGSDGKVHAIVGLRGESCARMEAKGWNKKSKAKKATILLQVERFE